MQKHKAHPKKKIRDAGLRAQRFQQMIEKMESYASVGLMSAWHKYKKSHRTLMRELLARKFFSFFQRDPESDQYPGFDGHRAAPLFRSSFAFRVDANFLVWFKDLFLSFLSFSQTMIRRFVFSAFSSPPPGVIDTAGLPVCLVPRLAAAPTPHPRLLD